MRPRDALAYVFLAVTWGLSFLVLVRVVSAFGWIGAVSFRCFIAAATLFTVAAATGRRLDLSMGWKPFAVVGATTVAGQLVGLSFGTPLIGTAMAAIIVATIPLFGMLFARLWGLERFTSLQIIGLVLGFGGIVMLVGFPAVPFTTEFVIGSLATLLACVSAAFGSCYASFKLRRASSWDITAFAFLAGGVITLPLILFVPVPGTLHLSDFVYLFVLGALMSATTYVIYFRLVATIGPTKAISVEFAVTVVAVIIGALVLHEPLSAIQIVGGAIIILGCALVIGLIAPRRASLGGH